MPQSLDLRPLAASLPCDGEASGPTTSVANDCDPASIPPQLRRKLSPPEFHAEDAILPAKETAARVVPQQEMHFAVLRGGLRAHAIEALRRREAASLMMQDAMEVVPESI
ncbi:hypothetical protein MVEN_00943400 [Mycena venus]|uniref:Uncharacterized protein n=1 Tax=Mycena venus TaxID=2733690 RepID=A0A8H7D2B0_9AGAR|nr:hypothetical protein MVEN_00943400 [Mycena venus]